LIKREIAPVKDVKFFKEPFNETANLLGNNKIMNMVAAGYLSAVTGFIKKESITASIRKIVAKKYEDLIDINIKAVEEGFKKGRKV
jgi:Pyruvate/2-oxoacid:ferredoxin oxidoreductase gamma subunit